MKKHLKHSFSIKSAVVLIVSATVLSGALAGSAAAASDGAAIVVTGTLLDNTCTIDEDNSDLTPSMGELSIRDLKGIGSTLGKRDINIVLKDCGSDITRGITVSVQGIDDASETDGTGFKNATEVSAGGADGVALQFYQTKDKSTPFTTDGKTTETITGLKKNTNTLAFAAAYISTQDEPAAGSFSTTVNLTLDYK